MYILLVLEILYIALQNEPMKLLFIFVLVSSPLCLRAQWDLQNAHSDQETRIHIVNQDTVIATTSDGGARIHRSFDGGATWQYTQTIFEYSWFNDIHFPSSNVGYVTGGTAFGNYSSILTKTTDAGVTWDLLTSNVFGTNLNHVHFINDTVGFISGDAGLLLKTSDGGMTILPQPAFPYNNYQCGDIEFTSDQTGFIALIEASGSAEQVYRILKTTDQGATWNELYEDTAYNVTGLNHRSISDIQFINENTGFAVGGSGLFLQTHDGGNSWDADLLSPYTTLNTVHFVNETTGYTDIAGVIHKTSDGGNTWNAQQMLPTSIVFDIEMIDENIGYAACDWGIYKTENGGDVVGIDDLNNSIELWPNPARNELNIHSDEIIETITIYDASARIVKTCSFQQEALDISDLERGTYTIVLSSSEENHITTFVKM